VWYLALDILTKKRELKTKKGGSFSGSLDPPSPPSRCSPAQKKGARRPEPWPARASEREGLGVWLPTALQPGRREVGHQWRRVGGMVKWRPSETTTDLVFDGSRLGFRRSVRRKERRNEPWHGRDCGPKQWQTETRNPNMGSTQFVHLTHLTGPLPWNRGG